MDRDEQIFAEGVSPSGETWRLGWQPDDHDGITWLRVTSPDGHTHKGGYGSPSLSPHSPVSIYIGSADNVPNGAIIRVPSGATGLEVTTSDGRIQTVTLVQHPVHQALVGACIYPRGTAVTAIRVTNQTGRHDVPITLHHL
jgi:hypothetical protein